MVPRKNALRASRFAWRLCTPSLPTNRIPYSWNIFFLLSVSVIVTKVYPVQYEKVSFNYIHIFKAYHASKYFTANYDLGLKRWGTYFCDIYFYAGYVKAEGCKNYYIKLPDLVKFVSFVWQEPNSKSFCSSKKRFLFVLIWL